MNIIDTIFKINYIINYNEVFVNTQAGAFGQEINTYINR